MPDDEQRVIVSLRDYFEQRFNSLELFVAEKFDWIEKNTKSAYQQMEHRLEGMNEFRNSLRDQASKFVTREEMTGYQKLVDSDLRVLREARAEMAGKASQSSVNNTFILAAVSAIAAVSGMVISVFSYLRK